MSGVAAGAADSPPMHRIQLPGNPTIRSAAFSPDGETLYVLVPDQAINIWELLVYFWPEIGGGFVAAALLAVVVAIRRVFRTPRISGEPYCRSCNYCLKAAVADRCPECFTPTTHPRIGRTHSRRLLPVASLAGLVVVGYLTPWALWLPRAGWVSTWRNWWSYEIEAAAGERGIQLAKWRQPVDRVYEIDVLAGVVRRTLFSQHATLAPYFGIAMTPDGGGLLIPTASERLALFDTETGAIRRTLQNPAPSTGRWSSWRHVAGFDESGKTAYVVCLDVQGERTLLMEWNLETGEESTLLTFDCDADDLSDRRVVMPRHIFRVPVRPLRFLELGNVAAGEASFEPIPAALHTLEGASFTRLPMLLPSARSCPPGFSANGGRVFVPTLNGLMPADLTTGISDREWRLRGEELLLTFCNAVPPGRMVISSLNSSGDGVAWNWLRFLVADLDSQRVIAEFGHLASASVVAKVCVAENGDFFAVSLGTQGRSPAAGPIHEILIFDLRSLAAASHEE